MTANDGSEARGSEQLRELSEQAVLEAIFRSGPITRPEIASSTNLSRPTVSAVVDRLERAGLVRADGARDGGRGRKPMAYSVSDRAGFVIGVDIGGTNLRAGATDLYGQFLHEEREPTTKDGSRALGQQITAMVGRCERAARATHQRPLALGISTPGVVDQASRRVTSLAYNLTPDGGFDPLGVIGERLGVPVVVDNNVNLAAIGEKWGGLARGVSDFAFLSIGAGVGMGIVLGDELVRGAHGAAGEIGYLPIGRDPFDARHRIHGGLEDEVGADGVLAAAHARTTWDGPAPTSAQEVFERAQAGDPTAGEVVSELAQKIGLAIATICSVIDPELVALGGGIGSNPTLVAPVRAAVAQLVPLTVRIETSLLAEKAALHGAVAVALREARAGLFSTLKAVAAS